MSILSRVFVVEAGEHEERCIIAICRLEVNAIEKKEEWNRKHAYEGSVIHERFGGDGVKRYLVNAAKITMWELED